MSIHCTNVLRWVKRVQKTGDGVHGEYVKVLQQQVLVKDDSGNGAKLEWRDVPEEVDG